MIHWAIVLLIVWETVKILIAVFTHGDTVEVSVFPVLITSTIAIVFLLFVNSLIQ